MRRFLRFPFLLLAFGGAFFSAAQSADATALPPELIACPDLQATAVRPMLFPATLGEQVTFSVEPSFDSAGRTSLTATLRAVGTASLVYVEDAYAASLTPSAQQELFSAAQAIAASFDSTIYPKLTAFYGKPWEPGIDGDVRITILLTKLRSNAGGYIDTTDEFPRAQAPSSNEREMVYVNATSATQPQRINSFIAHEFTHLIDFYQKKKLRGVEEEVWLNELRAEYAPTVAGYDTPFPDSNLAARVSTFLANPQDSLTEWRNEEADYATANLFAHYLAGHYGEGILAATMRSSAIGIASIDQALAAAGTADRFADIFQRFEDANYLASAQAGILFAYAQPELRSSVRLSAPTASVSVPSGGSASVVRSSKDWAGEWIRVMPSGVLGETLVISVSSAVPIRADALLTGRDGSKEVRSFAVATAGASLTIGNAASFSDIVIVPVLSGKTTGFTTGTPTGVLPSEALRSYTMTARSIPSDTPVLESVSPSAVLTFGGVAVTVRGSGFTRGTLTLMLDGQVLPATVLDDATLTFLAPSHVAGTSCLRVTVQGKGSERCDLLSFVAYADGNLLRGEGTAEVFVIQGRFRRHILSPTIFGFYPHLTWQSVIVVPREVIAQFRLSPWIRLPMTQDPMTWRVFEVNGDGTKHWITCANPDSCAATWIANGGDPNGIFTVNRQELDFYPEGAKVFLR